MAPGSAVPGPARQGTELTPAQAGRQLFGRFGRRVVARVIDWAPLIVGEVLFLIVANAGRTTKRVEIADGVYWETHSGLLSFDRAAWSTVVMIVLFAAMVAFWLWNLGIRQGRTGKSIGKSVMKLTARSAATGEVPGVGRCVLRAALDFVNFVVFCLGFIWVLTANGKEQTFTDLITSVVVVDDRLA